MAIEIVSFPMNSMVDLSSSLCGCLPEAKSHKIPSKPSFSYGFLIIFLWFSHHFPMAFMVFLWFSWFSCGFSMVFMIFLWFSYGFPLSQWSRPQIQVPRAPRFSASPRSCAAPWPPERWPGSPSPAMDSCQVIPYDLDMVYIYIYIYSIDFLYCIYIYIIHIYIVVNYIYHIYIYTYVYQRMSGTYVSFLYSEAMEALLLRFSGHPKNGACQTCRRCAKTQPLYAKGCRFGTP